MAESRAAVDAFFAAAVAAGVDIYTLRGFGGEYRVYCAFMSDSDGSNIEAVHKETQ